MLDDLVAVIETLKDRIQRHRDVLQANETRTRMALIDPLLTALGWDVADPGLVTPEYDVEGKRADYALLNSQGAPVVFLEAKRLGEQLSNHREQPLGYAIRRGMIYLALSNGDEWEVYDNSQYDKPLEQRDILKLSITSAPSAEAALKFLLLWRPSASYGELVQAAKPIVPPVVVQRREVDQPPPPPPPDPPGAEWVSLADFEGENIAKPRPVVRFPNGEERPITTWRAFLRAVAEWLVSANALTRSSCPIVSGGGRYIVHSEAVHSNGVRFRTAHTLSNGLFLETHLSRGDTVKWSRSLLESLGKDPSTVHLKTG